MAETQLFLDCHELTQMIRHKQTMQSKYNVIINAPDAAATLPTDLTHIIISGTEDKLREVVKFMNTYVFTALQKSFVFPPEYQSIFVNKDFIQIFEAIYGIRINCTLENTSLVVIGDDSSTNSAISTFNQLLSEFLNKLDNVTLLTNELIFVRTLVRFFQHLLPKYSKIIDSGSTTISSLLQNVRTAYVCPNQSDNNDDDIVIIKEVTPETREVCVITLSDDETEIISSINDNECHKRKNSNFDNLNECKSPKKRRNNKEVSSRPVSIQTGYLSTNRISPLKPSMGQRNISIAKINPLGSRSVCPPNNIGLHDSASSTNPSRPPINPSIGQCHVPTSQTDQRRDRNQRIVLIPKAGFGPPHGQGDVWMPITDSHRPSRCQGNVPMPNAYPFQPPRAQGNALVPYVDPCRPPCSITQTDPTLVHKLRPIVIDGSNIARQHGNETGNFSWEGIKICIEYFLKRGHTEVTVFVPKYKEHPVFKEVLKNLSKYVVFTPSRRIDGRQVASYDDRFIVELAVKNNGVIVSNDNYRDIMYESQEWKRVIDERLLMYCFVGDIIMFPKDPLGRHGPTLDELLMLPHT